MRLALEVFGLELALTFGPAVVDELEEDVPAQLQHVEGCFEAAPAAEAGYGEPDERARGGRVGFAPPGNSYV